MQVVALQADVDGKSLLLMEAPGLSRVAVVADTAGGPAHHPRVVRGVGEVAAIALPLWNHSMRTQVGRSSRARRQLAVALGTQGGGRTIQEFRVQGSVDSVAETAVAQVERPVDIAISLEPFVSVLMTLPAVLRGL